MGAVRRGDIVLVDLQPLDDLFGGLIVSRSALSVKIGHYLVQTIHADLCIVDKFQYVPTNCWLWGDSEPSCSSLFIVELEIVLIFFLRHSAPPELFFIG